MALRWLIYALRNFLSRNMLRVSRSNHHCSRQLHKFHRKTPVLESLFGKVAGLQAYFMFVFLYTRELMLIMLITSNPSVCINRYLNKSLSNNFKLSVSQLEKLLYHFHQNKEEL